MKKNNNNDFIIIMACMPPACQCLLINSELIISHSFSQSLRSPVVCVINVVCIVVDVALLSMMRLSLFMLRRVQLAPT